MTEAEKRCLLIEWSQAQAKLAAIKPLVETEMRLRKQVMAEYFPTPVEGVNTFQLESGWEMKGTYKIDRKIDEAALPAINIELRGMNVNPDRLVRFKPELDTTAYKTLVQINPEAARVFEKAMISKPASPSIELKPPKVKA
jgi:hypothetical protein